MYEKREKIRALLAKYYLSVGWLVHHLNRRGIEVTPNVVSNYIAGRRKKSDNAEKVLDASIDILNEYGLLYGEKTE